MVKVSKVALVSQVAQFVQVGQGVSSMCDGSGGRVC